MYILNSCFTWSMVYEGEINLQGNLFMNPSEPEWSEDNNLG